MLFWFHQQKENKENGYWQEDQMRFHEQTIMNELQKFIQEIKNNFDQYPNYALLNAKTFMGLANLAQFIKERENVYQKT